MAEVITAMRAEIGATADWTPRRRALERELPMLEAELAFWTGLRDRDQAWAAAAPTIAALEAELERKRPRFGHVTAQPTIWPGSPSAPAGAWRA